MNAGDTDIPFFSVCNLCRTNYIFLLVYLITRRKVILQLFISHVNQSVTSGNGDIDDVKQIFYLKYISTLSSLVKTFLF